MRQNKDKVQSTNLDFSGVLELVERLADILERTHLTEVRIRENELEVQVSRHPGRAAPVETPPLQPVEAKIAVGAPPPRTEEDRGVEAGEALQGNFINAPMPSRFYRAPAPEEPPFVEVGDSVRMGEHVAVLEVMKTYNPVEAPFNCEILEILVEDGEAVEYAQPLFRIKQQ